MDVWNTLILLCTIILAANCDTPYEQFTQFKKEYTLPALPYSYNGLEPYIDEATLRVHHLGHHAAYTKKMNAALKAWRESGEKAELASKSILEILKNIEEVPEDWQEAIKNNGGGFVNHGFYWAGMSPNPSKEARKPTGKIAELIDTTYGNFSEFKRWFDNEATTLFGSGYTWLCQDVTSGFLSMINMVNQESPVAYKLNPVLVIDIWEHAYYLKHQNKRAGYIDDWWTVVNWDGVNQLLVWWSKQKSHDEL
ncbi:hypothetical protein QZH41_009393 [Actinostola sp. cb2023]|nr:hypothetical protein QZH41_009393 [Actinostola sp. cb2023]